MAKEQKSKSELYREERKERLAKAAKKGGQGRSSVGINSASDKTDKKIAIGAVIALALAFVIWLLSFVGVPQRVSKVMEVGDISVSKAEYTYYFRRLYLTQLQQASYYAQFGLGGMGGFDASKAASEQEYTGGDMEKKEDGSNHTWEDYFRFKTEESIVQLKILGAKAEEAGITLTEEEIAAVDKDIADLEASVKDNSNGNGSSSLNVYLRNTFGAGTNKKALREYYLQEKLASKMLDAKVDEFGGKLTDERINKYYEENKDKFDVVDICVFPVKYDVEDNKDTEDKTSKTEAKNKADEMLGKVTDADSFAKLAKEYAGEKDKEKFGERAASVWTAINNADLKSSSDEKVSEWAFSADRKAGDKTVIEGNKTFYVVSLASVRHADNAAAVNVRHILFKYADDATDAQKAEVEANAKALYEQWRGGKADEASFAELAKTHSADGSKDNGGLIENIKKGQMVQEFEDWCLDSSRKPGDSGVITTKYGAHIMYFSSTNDEPIWKSDIKETLKGEDFNAYYKELKESDTFKVNANDKKLSKLIGKIAKPQM